MQYRRIFLVFTAASLAFRAENAAAKDKLPHEILAMYAAVGLSPPTAARMTVCYGFACRRRMELVFTANERATLKRILTRGGPSPAAERKAIQRAFLWFDHRVGGPVKIEDAVRVNETARDRRGRIRG